jgi:hypothetical protein
VAAATSACRCSAACMATKGGRHKSIIPSRTYFKVLLLTGVCFQAVSAAERENAYCDRQWHNKITQRRFSVSLQTSPCANTRPGPATVLPVKHFVYIVILLPCVICALSCRLTYQFDDGAHGYTLGQGATPAHNCCSRSLICTSCRFNLLRNDTQAA